MRFKKLILGISIVIVLLMLLSILGFGEKGCMDITVGKGASVDGSVMTSQTADGWYDSNIRVVDGFTNTDPTAMADVYWNLTGEEPVPPTRIGRIPQKMGDIYTYFHTAYSPMNERQLMIGETTIPQKEILRVFPPNNWTNYNGPIMTIEQLQIFALQRTDKARDAIKEMGMLAERYGFLPSCEGMGECLTIADTTEAWVFEIFSVGKDWDKKNFSPGKSATFGAVWAAQRVRDDELVCVPNISRIREIDTYPGNPDFMFSDNYKQFAIQHGIAEYDKDGKFIWQESYTPAEGDWSLSSEGVKIRLFLVYSYAEPKFLSPDPNRATKEYPFSFPPDPKRFPQGMSVQNLIDLQRSTLTGTEFDMEADPAWLVLNPKFVSLPLSIEELRGVLPLPRKLKSPLATPFPDKYMRTLLDIEWHRPAAMYDCSYGMVSQSRGWLPDPIGGVLWFYLDNPHMSVHVPIYAGVTEILPSWQNFDRNVFSLDSARWAFALADDLVNRRYQSAIQDLKLVRDPLQQEFLDHQAEIELEALNLYNTSGGGGEDAAKQVLTNFTKNCMDEAEQAYWNLNWDLIQKYNNNKF